MGAGRQTGRQRAGKNFYAFSLSPLHLSFGDFYVIHREGSFCYAEVCVSVP